ncbi:MAG: glutamate-1-semialdehyde 2,1-aminomutase [Methanophagales archaeon]|nr:glutamate-1-semialdehyde 2,1-aminomutase [Methanophagales archaeon]RLG32309.1 MAG: glutamate-1-semialdehyde-2,1-aminomutase [Methanosarcinales archaeon]
MNSENLFELASKYMPGGVSSPVRAYKPYPFFTASAKGSRIYDVDGREYIDYCLAYGPLVLGHGNEEVKEAVREQLEHGWLYGTPHEKEIELAKKIISNYPSVDLVRFVNTGSEATMAGIRLARGFKERDKIVKIEGGFHGAHDGVLVKAGSGATTHGIPDSIGVPADSVINTLQVPFNDPEALNNTLEKNSGDVAAVIIEPVMGNVGPIPPQDNYLHEVRKITSESDVLLILDEVITGFRLALGGAQEFYGVDADLTILGKIVGGGFPIGVLGGRKEIMELIAPSGGVYQAGTFSGNPVSITAGLKTIEIIEREGLGKLNEFGARMQTAISEILVDSGVEGCVSGVGSMFKIFFSPSGKEVRNYADALSCDKNKYLRFFHSMLSAGIFLPPSQFETNFISFAHTDADIERTIEVYKENLKHFRGR